MERSWREGPGEGSHLTEYALSLHDKKTQPPATRIGDLLSASSGNGSNTRRFSTTGSSAHVSPITRKEVSPNKSLFFQSFKKQTGPTTDLQRERSLSSLSLPKIFNLTEVDNLSSTSSPIRSPSMISFGFKELLEDEEPRDVTHVKFSSIENPPFDIKLDSTVLLTVKRIRLPVKNMAKFKSYFDNSESRTILNTCFWFVFCAFFQQQSMSDSSLTSMVDEMSNSIRGLFWKMSRDDRDAFFDCYHYAISYSIVKGFRYHFPGSKAVSSSSFKMRVYELISEMLTGIRLRKNVIERGILKYFPKHWDNQRKDRKHKDVLEENEEISEVVADDDEIVSIETEDDSSKRALSDLFRGAGTDHKSRIDEEYETSAVKATAVSFQGIGEDLGTQQRIESPRYSVQSVHNMIRRKSTLSLIDRKVTTAPAARKRKPTSVRARVKTSMDNTRHYSKSTPLVKDMNIDNRFWNSYTMSPLLSRFHRPPVELAKAGTQHLLPKTGVNNAFFFGSTERTVRQMKKAEPRSVEMFKRSLLRQKMILENDERNREETDRTIRWVRRKAHKEMKTLNTQAKDFLSDKNRLLSDLYDHVREEREQKRKSKANTGFALGVVRKEPYDYHWKEELSLKNVNLKNVQV